VVERSTTGSSLKANLGTANWSAARPHEASEESTRRNRFREDLSRIYAVGNWLALTLTLSPKRGKQVWPRWDESLIGERRAALESVSLSPGERAGVRASVLSTELFRLRGHYYEEDYGNFGLCGDRC